jgi:hypothetical protein
VNSLLSEHLVASKGSVRFYRLCANCVEKVQTVGGAPPQEALLFII